VSRSLHKALQQEKLEEFIAEREEVPAADQERFEAILNSMAQTSKQAPETSDQDECDD
jgi:hypothetical protein